jgi:acetyl esterase/lipase
MESVEGAIASIIACRLPRAPGVSHDAGLEDSISIPMVPCVVMTPKSIARTSGSEPPRRPSTECGGGKRRSFGAISATIAFVLFGFALAPSHGFDAARPDTREYDVVYAERDGLSLGMDLSIPGTPGPWPAVIAIHGGGWSEGDKSGFDLGPLMRGYLVASINYRLYPAYRFPAMIEDVKSAIRYLRAHANTLNIDPGRIGLIGHSAGGHLAALAGLADETAGWEVGDFLEQSSRVQAVVVLSGPADLSKALPLAWADELRYSVFGERQWSTASPVSYARADAPPFLIVHGNSDPVVPFEQGKALHDALRAHGARSELLVVRNGGHGFEPVGGAVSPALDEVARNVLRFLEKNLR